MHLSKEDSFCYDQQIAATGDTVSTNVLDFNKHGDDLQNQLHLCIQSAGAIAGDGTVSIVWQTSDAEAFGSGVVEHLLTPTALSPSTTVAGTWIVKNAALPKSLKRYQRLKFSVTLGQGETMTTAPKFRAFIVDGRQEPL